MSEEGLHLETQDRGGALPKIVQRHVMLAWASLSAERFWPLLWPAGGIVGLFVILALTNVFVYLPEWLHLLVLVAFIAAIAWAVAYSMKLTSVPSRSQAVRHLEQSSGLDHRPLSALEDKPATGTDDDTKRLWQAHRQWVLHHINRLKVGWPRLSLAARDPQALRMLILIAIVALTILNWSEVPSRLASALSPGWAQGKGPATFEAWVTAPAYTGEPPKHLTATTRSDGEAISVPKGSTLTVRTHGDASAVMRVGSLGSSLAPSARPEFLPAGGDARDAKLAINSDMTVRLSLNASQVGIWRISTTADQPPRIWFKTPPTVTNAQSLRFHYAIKDDYGVAAASAKIELDHKATPSDRKAPAPMTFELPLPPSPARDGDATIFKDLTAHVWAGLKVKITLLARDEFGQTAASKAITMVLPERRFNEPLARALIEQRRSLARDAASSQFVARALDALSFAPERFTPDQRIYLGLRTAYYMVWRARGGAELTGAQQLLWDLALKIEQGDTPQAQEELRQVQQKLMDALARGAPQAEIEALMAQLRAAMERALKAMAEKAQGQTSAMQGMGGQIIRAQDLQSMLDQIQNLTRQGSRAAAQQMLAQLQEMLENMQVAGTGQMTGEQKSMTESLEKLGQLIAKQRALMDKTFREQQQALESGAAKAPSALKGEQAKLSDELTAMIKKAGQGPAAQALKQAQDAMDEAADNLAAGELGEAGKSQQKAIDQLRNGGQAVAQQLLQQMQAQGAVGQGQGMGTGENEDPFGRPQASYGQSFGGSVKVPEKLDIQKAREILEELQRRAAERGRPINELEYIDRLLRRF